MRVQPSVPMRARAQVLQYEDLAAARACGRQAPVLYDVAAAKAAAITGPWLREAAATTARVAVIALGAAR
jgi:hypothetical protein